MILRLLGALVRAVLMGVVVVLPSLLVPGTPPDTAQISALLAMVVMIFTLVEYGSSYPGLVEFRDAPPYNRIRFAVMALSVLLLSLSVRGHEAPDTISAFVNALGAAMAHLLDFPFSPVRLLTLAIPAEDAELRAHLAIAAGLAYPVALAGIAGFALVIRVGGWPGPGFNIWVNLPMFDPMSGHDVVYKLERDAVVNMALGVTLPFVLPVLLGLGVTGFKVEALAHPHTQIWVVTALAFLPMSLVMRGMALARVATLIRRERQRRALRAGASPRGALA